MLNQHQIQTVFCTIAACFFLFFFHFRRPFLFLLNFRMICMTENETGSKWKKERRRWRKEKRRKKIASTRSIQKQSINILNVLTHLYCICISFVFGCTTQQHGYTVSRSVSLHSEMMPFTKLNISRINVDKNYYSQRETADGSNRMNNKRKKPHAKRFGPMFQ